MSSLQHVASLESLVSRGKNVLEPPKAVASETVAAMKAGVSGLSRTQKRKLKKAAANAVAAEKAAAAEQRVKELELEV